MPETRKPGNTEVRNHGCSETRRNGKKMDRRIFLQRLGLTAAAGFALSCGDNTRETGTTSTNTGMNAAGLGIPASAAGVQMYTLRSIVNGDFEPVIRSVAGIGYKEIELAGFHNLTAAEIRTLMDELGISAPSTHIGASLLRTDLDQVIEDGNTLGHEYIICPHPGELAYDTLDDYKAMAEFFNEVGTKVKDAGMQFGYHNHEFEFEALDGTLPIDVLMENTDPNLVIMELDLCWAWVAGADHVAFFEKYPGRTHLCHVKDYTEGGEMRDVGQGDINFAHIFAHAETAGLKHYVVEHDNPEDPIQSITNSFAHLTG